MDLPSLDEDSKSFISHLPETVATVPPNGQHSQVSSSYSLVEIRKYLSGSSHFSGISGPITTSLASYGCIFIVQLDHRNPRESSRRHSPIAPQQVAESVAESMVLMP